VNFESLCIATWSLELKSLDRLEPLVGEIQGDDIASIILQKTMR
jgi:hypothetical protein